LETNAILTNFVIVKETKKLMLLILDGWGYGKHDTSNAIESAKTPFFNHLLSTYPNSRLKASGESVGLPEGQMGNSEVGHINLGAGRVVYQELGRINKAIIDGDLKENETLSEAFAYAKNHQKNVHLIGLLSDGGVHSHTQHLIGLCEAAKSKGLSNIFIHAFLDGRDTDPHSGIQYIENVENELKSNPARIVSAIGRYYAMDRDHRWERIKKAYDLLVKGKGEKVQSISEAIKSSYSAGITDEFILPISKVDERGEPLATINEGDVVICFNFRTDRAREITMALTQIPLPEYDMQPLNLHYITMTSYDETFKNVGVIFRKDDVRLTLGEVLEQNHKTQVRIAETEKYPHVTFFFSGGREKEFENERRLLIPSPKVATYDLQPEMSAQAIADTICEDIKTNHPDFVCLNFANPDMVGHTGVFSAVVKAVETVDSCAKQVVECGIKEGYSFIILADHGNAEFMLNEDGTVNTAHTTNLVPCILIDSDFKTIQNGKLGDVAPTILKIMNIPIPKEMTGEILV
jgi:2,3-bisphosphoglycerate-independent phosphoglycerate mutase